MKALRPYLYHAYYHWIIDNEYTPYLLVNANYPDVDVPKEYINEESKIVLNIAPSSIGQYSVDNEYICFNARFNGMVRDITIPFGAAEAVYSRETGDGVMFQPEMYYEQAQYLARRQHNEETVNTTKVSRKKGHLKLVK